MSDGIVHEAAGSSLRRHIDGELFPKRAVRDFYAIIQLRLFSHGIGDFGDDRGYNCWPLKGMFLPKSLTSEELDH